MQVAARLPKRVPVGTKYVIEGKSRGAGQVHVFARYLVFPDGRCFELPSDVPPAAIPPRRRSGVQAARRNNSKLRDVDCASPSR